MIRIKESALGRSDYDCDVLWRLGKCECGSYKPESICKGEYINCPGYREQVKELNRAARERKARLPRDAVSYSTEKISQLFELLWRDKVVLVRRVENGFSGREDYVVLGFVAEKEFNGTLDGERVTYYYTPIGIKDQKSCRGFLRKEREVKITPCTNVIFDRAKKKQKPARREAA